MSRSKFQNNLTIKYSILDQEWEIILKLIIQHSIDSKKRAFVFKFYNGLVYANKQYRKFGYRTDATCSFCPEKEQTFEHLYGECPEVQEFKSNIGNRWFKDNSFKERDWVVGKDNPFWNFVIMEINQYIHASNYKRTPLSLMGMRSRLYTIEEVEKVIATRKNKLSTHMYKWVMVKNWVP